MCNVSRSWIGHNRSSWIRVKAVKRSWSAGGLKVKALSQTPRDAGLSPAQCSLFLQKIALRENIIYLIAVIVFIMICQYYDNLENNLYNMIRRYCVKVQNMKCNKMCGWYLILCQFLDNSDSPSIVEQ